MARSAVLPLKATEPEIDIYSNKSSLILFWLLINHDNLKSESFSVNELSRRTGTSTGLAHKIIKQLEYEGIVVAKGLRTGKKFYLKSPDKILLSWVGEYSLTRKTKTKGYAAFDVASAKSKLNLVPALHMASVEFFHLKTTNLKAKEYYLLNWKNLPKLTEQLDLIELDRGYEVLLVKPYYTSLVEKIFEDADKKWMQAYEVLTVLDLLHFPLRGIEQAETLFRKSEILKNICSWSAVENAVG